MFSSVSCGKIRWPLCYVSSILEHFMGMYPVLGIMAEMITVSLTVHASMVGTGLDWEIIIQLALSFQCMNCQLNNITTLPLGFNTEYPAPKFHIKTMPGEVKTLDSAKQYFNSLVLDNNTITLINLSYASFPIFDGFLVYKYLIIVFLLLAIKQS